MRHHMYLGGFAICLAAVGAVEPFPEKGSWNVRGTALGGLFVLEPWITPSLFYQFEGKAPKDTAVDVYHFCEILGGEEANRQLRHLWDNWVKQEDIEKLASLGINAVRIPVGDYMFEPYGPYLNGCMNSSLAHLDRVLGWCGANNISAVLDLHVAMGCQNGFDNGGVSQDLWWEPNGGRYNKSLAPRWMFSDYYTFLDEQGQTWYVRKDSDGNFAPPSKDFPQFTIDDWNQKHIDHTLRVLEEIAVRFDPNPTVVSIEIINEPWLTTPIAPLKKFYQMAQDTIKKVSPRMITMYHDSFRFDPDIWGGQLPDENANDTVLDTHIYYAWTAPMNNKDLVESACSHAADIKKMKDLGTRVIVGEWSLATDTCAMFLTGYNSALGEVVYTCQENACPSDFSPGNRVQPMFPYTDSVKAGFGPTTNLTCPITAVPFQKELVTLFSRALMNAYSSGDGWFFWNFKTENNDPRWSYMGAVEAGYLPSDVSSFDSSVTDACLPATLDKACKSGVNCTGYVADFTDSYKKAHGMLPTPAPPTSSTSTPTPVSPVNPAGGANNINLWVAAVISLGVILLATCGFFACKTQSRLLNLKDRNLIGMTQDNLLQNAAEP